MTKEESPEQIYENVQRNPTVSVQIYKQEVNNNELMKKMRILKDENEELIREKEDLNVTLRIIFTFNNFPVAEYCPNKKCRPCQTGWVQFQDKCYLFYKEPDWKTWTQSHQFCLNKDADLVVIDDLREQEFISNHTEFYYDNMHGYWIGLQNINNNWVWTDGRNDTLGFWMSETFGNSGPYILLIPGRTATKNWDTSDNVFQNRFICECDALIGLNVSLFL